MSIVDLTASIDSRLGGPPVSVPFDSPPGDWDVSEVTGSPPQGEDPGTPAPETGTRVADVAQPVPDPPPGQGPDATVTPGGERPLVTGTRPSFTITEAATACAVSRKTITRKLADFAEHGAAKDEDGVWRIPVEALLAVGLHPGRSVPATTRSSAPTRGAGATPTTSELGRSGSAYPARTVPAPPPDVVTITRDRWDDLRLRLARAEAEAAERALALADARLALRALTAAPHTMRAEPGAPGPALFTGASQRPAEAGRPAGLRSPAEPGSPAELRSPAQAAKPAAGWVHVADFPPAQGRLPPPAASDPGSAPPVPAAPPPARKRRWWQSAAG